MSKSTYFFTPEEIKIVNANAPKIVDKAISGEWSVVRVNEAFIKAAIVVHQLVLRSLIRIAVAKTNVLNAVVVETENHLRSCTLPPDDKRLSPGGFQAAKLFYWLCVEAY